ncbi:MAG: PAS domain S-box protein [Leptospirales bacterium]|nr:PAS domain S-box protein [Leptospirales bacterium]
MASLLHVASDPRYARDEEYYRALGEITLYKHREKLINELLTYLASVIGDLERSEHRIRAIVDTAADGIISLDQAGRIQSANAAAVQIFGSDNGRVTGRELAEFFADVKEFGEALRLAAESGASSRELRGRRVDSAVFPAHLAIARLQFEGSLMFTAIVRDITEQKQAEQLVAQAAAKQETDKILNAIDQGLFLIYQREGDYFVSGQYSQATASLLGEDPSERDFLKLISAHISEAALKSAQSYLKLMFDQKVFAGSLEQLNPLSEISFSHGAPGEAPESRLLRFSFRRVSENESIAHLMATVIDVTAEAALREQLKANERKAQSQMELLFRILHVDSAMLAEFIDEARIELDLIDGILKEADNNRSLPARLQAIFRSVHKIKGDADLLGLEFLAQRLHQVEEKVSQAIRKPDLNAGDFFPFLVAFGEIVGLIDETSQLTERLLDFRDRFGERQPQREGTDTLQRSFQGLVQKISEELGKQVSFDCSAFEASLLASAQRMPAKGLIVQLLKNALAHGVESPEERLKVGKPLPGSIRLSSAIHDDRLEISVSDDGRGLDPARLRRVAVESGLLSTARASELSDRQAAALIFRSGVSSAEKAHLHAGRGVGMPMIREIVRAMGGKLRLRSSTGRGLTVTASLPRLAADSPARQPA